MQHSAFGMIHQAHDPLWSLARTDGKHRLLQPGQTLFEKGDRARYVYLVASGRLDVFRNQGKWRIVWSRGPGEAVAFDCGGRHDLNCRAAQTTELIAVDRSRLLRAAEHSSMLQRRLKALHEDELELMLSTLGDRSAMTSTAVIDFCKVVKIPAGKRRRPHSGAPKACSPAWPGDVQMASGHDVSPGRDDRRTARP